MKGSAEVLQVRGAPEAYFPARGDVSDHYHNVIFRDLRYYEGFPEQPQDLVYPPIQTFDQGFLHLTNIILLNVTRCNSNSPAGRLRSTPSSVVSGLTPVS